MIKHFAALTGTAALLAVTGVSAAAAPKIKPLGYIYGECTSKTVCTYQGSTDAKQKKLSLSSTAICSSGSSALSQIGYVPVKHGGKFSVSRTIMGGGPESSVSSSVHVRFSGTLKAGKKVTGSLEITTTASDCTADTGVSKSFSMKYKGPFYGG